MSKRILVIGDAILDRHICGSHSRLSPEAPVPVVDVESESYTLGGAANVAAQIAVYGEPTYLLYKSFRTYTDNENEHILSSKLRKANVTHRRLWINSEGFTTVKTRVWSNNQQVVRFDKEDCTHPDEEYANWLFTIQDSIINNKINIVVFSDYDKGTLSDHLIGDVVKICNERNIVTILDPKRKTFHYIKGLSIVKLNLVEMIKASFSIEQCSEKMPDTYIVNTRGKDSTLVYLNGEHIYEVPTSDQEVVDVCGAGDVHCAILALTFNDTDILTSVFKANKAASISILHRGCYNLNKKQLKRII